MKFKLFVLFSLLTSLTAGQVTRKPYLQVPSPNSIVVRWQTATGEVGKFWYGSSPAALTQSLPESPDERIYHEIKVTDLKPATKYYYSVRGQKGDEQQYFITPPEKGKAQPVRIWVISDFGQTSSAQNPRRLETVATWKNFNRGNTHADFVLSIGDQTEDDAVYQLQHDFFNTVENVMVNSPLYTTIGNHDNHDSLYNYLRTFTLPANAEAGGVPSGTEKYYSFDYSNVHVVVLCTEIYDSAGIAAQANWLKQDLEQNRSEWLIACLHQPFHSGGYHPSDNNKSNQERKDAYLPVLFKHGVDLILQGHNHIYERSYMVHYLTGKAMEVTSVNKIDTGKGPYQKKKGPSGKGTVFLTCASGGVVNVAAKFVHYPIFPVYFNEKKLEGSLVLDINKNIMTVSFLCDEVNSSGSHVWDHFAIVKN